MRSNNIKFVYSYMRQYVGVWIAGILLTILASFIQIKYSWLIQQLIDDALLPKKFELLLRLCIQFFALVIICSLLSFIKEWCFNYVSQKTIIKMRTDLFLHLIKLPYSFFVKNDEGEIINKIINDVKNTQDAFSDYIISLLTSIITSAFIVIWLFIVNWKLTILFLAIVPIFCLVTNKIWKIINKLGHKNSELTGELTGFLQEVISSVILIKMSGGTYFINKLKEICELLAENVIKLRMSSAFNNSLWESILTPYQAIYYLIGGYWYIKYGTPSIGTMLVFVNLVGILIPNTLTILDSISGMANGVASLERIRELLNCKEEESGELQLDLQDDITIKFDNVDFKFDDSNFEIKNFNLILKQGDFLTIVGQTGSGKSTILKLLVRLYDVDKGEITINGINIKNYRLADLRKHFGFLQQDMYIVKGSIKDNILLSDNSITDEQIKNAICMAKLDDFINHNLQGIFTVIGERGKTLSGGEKQRLSLARMLAGGLNKIVIMDEPTSALDIETEREILKEIAPMLKQRIAIAIDHRLATLNMATKIIVMKKGMIIEEGTYEELMKKGGEFHELVNTKYTKEIQ